LSFNVENTKKGFNSKRSITMSEQQNSHILTRREMLKLTGAAGVGLLATACVQAAPAEPQVVEKVVTVEVEKLVEVEKVVPVEVEKVVPAPEMEAVTVSGALWILQKKDFFPAYNDYFREEIIAFAKEKGWPYDISYIAGFTGGTPEVQKIAASVEAGNPPDLIMHTLSAVQLRNLYALDPLNDVVQEIEELWGKATPRMYTDFFFENQWWAVPFHQRSDGGWYRTDVWEPSGIDIQSLRTYPELLEGCLAVSRPEEEIYGWGVTINRSSDANYFINRVKTGWGASWQDETGQYINCNSAEMVEAISWLVDIYTNPKWEPALPPGVLSWTDSTNNEAYLGGRLAYTQNGGTVYAKAILDENPVAELTGFHPPAGGPALPEFNYLSANSWMLLRGAKNPGAAKEVIRHFMLSPEKMDEVFAAAPAFAVPCFVDLWEKSAYIKSNEVALQQKSSSLDPSGIDPLVYPGPPSPAMIAIDNGGIWNDMINAALDGTPVPEAVATAHERMVKIFQEFGLPGEKV
jgi:multiple sugar transport system substrate-binding protein